MVAADKYLIERTSSHPGTEMRTCPNYTEPELPRDGDQYIIPGTVRISTRELRQGLATAEASQW
jgi:hypothetical protein